MREWEVSSAAPVSVTAMERRSEKLCWIRWVLKYTRLYLCLLMNLTDKSDWSHSHCCGRSGSARHAEGSVTAASVVPEKVVVLRECWFTWLNTTAMTMCTPIWIGNWSSCKKFIACYFCITCKFNTEVFFSPLQLEKGAGGERQVKCGRRSSCCSWTWLTCYVTILTYAQFKYCS